MSERIFSDLDLAFTKHPVTKDVSKKTKENAVINSIKNLILLNRFEKPFNPNIGSNINSMLFEPLDNITASVIRNEIIILIQNYEQRVRIQDVIVTPNIDNNRFDVVLRFSIINSLKPITVSVFLNRLR